MSSLYLNIKKRRLALDMSQDELAKIMKYSSRSSINKIEMGKSDIPQSKISAFAAALNTTPSVLMGWEDFSDEKTALEVQPLSSEQQEVYDAVSSLENDDLQKALSFARFLKNQHK